HLKFDVGHAMVNRTMIHPMATPIATASTKLAIDNAMPNVPSSILAAKTSSPMQTPHLNPCNIRFILLYTFVIQAE
ncbi:MAG: hypothetical protein SCH66_03485, partial [Methanolobus sp.]|nr:hypothetical protein [Methanolobus sp.]